MSEQEECCPPQSTSQPSKPKVPHPVAPPTGYEPKGAYQPVGNYDKVYVTGPDDAKHAVVVIYDIFGFWETTIRGMDLLANHLLLTRPTRIFVPDVYRGKPFDPAKDGQKEELQGFFAGTANIDARLPEVLTFGETLKVQYSSVAIQGYCWGGKVTVRAISHGDNPFSCGTVVHPAMLEDDDGKGVTVPFGFYPSADENKEVVEKINEDLKAKSFYSKCDSHLYGSVHHGWAAARADLKDPENLKQYNDVYQRLADFYAAQ